MTRIMIHTRLRYGYSRKVFLVFVFVTTQTQRDTMHTHNIVYHDLS